MFPQIVEMKLLSSFEKFCVTALRSIVMSQKYSILNIIYELGLNANINIRYFLLQIMLLLYIAHCMIQILWSWKIDPDNSAIPLLTALGDLSGMICLTIAFMIYKSITQ